MRILSMTATFGKLDHETLTLQPGLNVIHAPNEWGKSTWCAFLVAMLYGIETRVHSTKAALADKERFAPWNGAPMSGRIELLWNEKHLTIERRSKGRSVFNEFRAYETATGIAVPELTAANCGQVLLGIEKSVFLRSGFLRLNDLPVTQDESLRRRLNALVTTGDESGTSDRLAQKLRDLKNRCRFNRSGLLPQAEQQKAQLEDALSRLRALQSQTQRLHIRQHELEQHTQNLENHRDALKYEESHAYARKLSQAQASVTEAAREVARLQEICQTLPDKNTAERKLNHLRQLREHWDSLHMEMQMLPQPPVPPEVPPCFRDRAPESVVAETQKDRETYAALLDSRKRFPKVLLFIAIGLLLAATGFLLGSFPLPAAITGLLGVAAGVTHFVLGTSAKKYNARLDSQLQAITVRYAPLPPEQWEPQAKRYAEEMSAYQSRFSAFQASRGDLDSRAADLKAQLLSLAENGSLQAYQQRWVSVLEQRQALEDARREHRRAEDLLQAITASHREVPPPKFPDQLTFTEPETAKLLADAAAEQRQLQLRLGQTMGQMESLGQERQLMQQLDIVNQRIAQLEDTYAALTLAMQTLADASNALQRRFAPRISQRAQALFHRLTGGRYDRLTLGEDLSVHAGTGQEDTLRSSLWRSDGTVDQLYLALRLAVAEELTPDAPLILDDALVRFDDDRLNAAMEMLSELAQDRQILLFTCQSREAQVLSRLSAQL